MRVRRKVITLKELISHFHSLMDTIQKESPILNSKHSFSKRTDYLPERYELANGQEVHLEIGQRGHISDILEIQRQGYEGKTPWGFVALVSLSSPTFLSIFISYPSASAILMRLLNV